MLKTARLFLRPMNETDVDAVFAMRSDSDVMRFIRPQQIEKSEAESWINLISSRWETEKIGLCAVFEKTSDKFVGWCGLWRLAETGEVEIGYALAKEFWKKGFAVEASQAFLEYGFEKLKLEKIVAVTDPENENSRRVMEKLGMSLDGIGKYYGRDLVHYSIVADDFLKSKNGEKSIFYNL